MTANMVHKIVEALENTLMDKETLDVPSDLRAKPLYHGTRVVHKTGDLIEPGYLPNEDERKRLANTVLLTPELDEAIWEAEIAIGENPGRVYIVKPTGPINDVSDLFDLSSLGHPSMSCYSREPLRVIGEVANWPLYHGTRAELKKGDLIRPGLTPNFGSKDRVTTYVYLTRTLDAATWGAELAVGEGQSRIYAVEPTGTIEDDPNLTNKKFRGNPTKSFRCREPLKVTGEIKDWQGHSPEMIKAMKDNLERLERLGEEPIE